ncbi:hypothetical protein Sste5346_003708 [Sporothrix stenoceras]|uniref:Xylanolytic transcriptional activator regulatory domain-containing protein n=1 Tax=Sporothrix stenoceras TaxID=5173 RepID=A0ABR3ZB06_9PEZI
MASPPNVPSNEDDWAFAWNPSSATVRQSQPIHVCDDDPLFLNHSSRHDMSAATWDGVRTTVCGEQPGEHPGEHGTAPGVILPSLKIANAFVGLFFKHFFCQAPVLHEPTMSIDALPPPLIAIMVVIGAKYSHLRHTRRFSILLLDKARRSLQTAIENDTRLVRSTHTIYAYALICYTGLWCGNKRAFEIAESLRGTLVTYVRRLPHEEMQAQTNQIATQGQISLETQWQQWAAAEMRRKLKWFVFTLDSQFPVLLNIRGMFSLAEISDWELPCDEEFWAASTARSWKRLLGMAPIPPAPQFTTALLPFLPALVHGTGTDSSNSLRCGPVPLSMRLNQWSAFLLLTVVSNQAFELSQEWTLAEAFRRETAQDSGGDTSNETTVGDESISVKFNNLLDRKAKISGK